MGILNFFSINSRTRLIINNFKLDKTLSYSWGMKKSGEFIRKNSKRSKFAYLEDGFIHSFGVKKKKLPLSICYDNNGIYYDCNSRNDLKEFAIDFGKFLIKKDLGRIRVAEHIINDLTKAIEKSQI